MSVIQEKQVILIIGPPDNKDKYPLLDEIKKLYDLGEKEAYNEFYKLQEEALSKLIKYNEKEVLKSLLELVIGKKIKNLNSKIDLSVTKGWMLPSITIDATNSILENREPLHLHLNREKLKQISAVIGENLNARWMDVHNNFLGEN
tara:strand:- start:19 stop:456 length:438 start_codon:yes stop_codon:yes gene_type:complete